MRRPEFTLSKLVLRSQGLLLAFHRASADHVGWCVRHDAAHLADELEYSTGGRPSDQSTVSSGHGGAQYMYSSWAYRCFR